MEGSEKKMTVKQLLEKGKASGRLTTQEIDAAIVEMVIDIEELDKFYETIESQHIEIIDNLDDDLSYENITFDIDVSKTGEVGTSSDEKSASMEDPVMRSALRITIPPPRNVWPRPTFALLSALQSAMWAEACSSWI